MATNITEGQINWLKGQYKDHFPTIMEWTTEYLLKTDIVRPEDKIDKFSRLVEEIRVLIRKDFIDKNCVRRLRYAFNKMPHTHNVNMNEVLGKNKLREHCEYLYPYASVMLPNIESFYSTDINIIIVRLMSKLVVDCVAEFESAEMSRALKLSSMYSQPKNNALVRLSKKRPMNGCANCTIQDESFSRLRCCRQLVCQECASKLLEQCPLCKATLEELQAAKNIALATALRE